MNCVTQKLKPLTKNDLTAELIGREVVWNSANRIDLKVVKRYEVIDINLKQELITIKDDVGDLRTLFIERFALPVEDQERKPVTVPGPEGFSDDWTAEITHSCTLEFPNGETVTVPGPEGDDWNAETERFDWPKIHWADLGATTQTNISHPSHFKGKLIEDEYHTRMVRENARIISITKWTRDPNYQPPEREETFEERAIRRYPSRMRG